MGHYQNRVEGATIEIVYTPIPDDVAFRRWQHSIEILFARFYDINKILLEIAAPAAGAEEPAQEGINYVQYSTVEENQQQPRAPQPGDLLPVERDDRS